MNETMQLGKSGINISNLGMGLMQWGDINFTGGTGTLPNATVLQMFQAALDRGITFYDTAEMYGNGKSESHLHGCLNSRSANIIIATKFMPFPWRLSKGELRSALKNSLKRLGIDHVDLYQMHWPFPPVPISVWMEAMADAFKEGLIRAIGVSNYSPNQVKIAADALARHNIPLASNQVKYNLLDRRPERSGLVDTCNKLGISIIAYSPLEKGILTGKYGMNNLPRGILAWRYNKSFIIRLQPLFSTLGEISEAHNGKSPAMISLNWLMCKGVVPIPGARNPKQVIENTGAIGWKLTESEIARLDEISTHLK